MTTGAYGPRPRGDRQNYTNAATSLSLYTYIYIYIYTHTYTHTHTQGIHFYSVVCDGCALLLDYAWIICIDYVINYNIYVCMYLIYLSIYLSLSLYLSISLSLYIYICICIYVYISFVAASQEIAQQCALLCCVQRKLGYFREFHEPGLWCSSTQFWRGFVVSSPQISAILVGHFTGENYSLHKSPQFNQFSARIPEQLSRIKGQNPGSRNSSGYFAALHEGAVGSGSIVNRSPPLPLALLIQI